MAHGASGIVTVVCEGVMIGGGAVLRRHGSVLGLGTPSVDKKRGTTHHPLACSISKSRGGWTVRSLERASADAAQVPRTQGGRSSSRHCLDGISQGGRQTHTPRGADAPVDQEARKAQLALGEA